MATRSTTKPLSTKHVETLTHDEAKRKNIPSVEQHSIASQEQTALRQIRYPLSGLDEGVDSVARKISQPRFGGIT